MNIRDDDQVSAVALVVESETQTAAQVIEDDGTVEDIVLEDVGLDAGADDGDGDGADDGDGDDAGDADGPETED